MTGDRSRFSLLYDLGCAFAARLELEELAPLVIAKCRDALDAEGAALLLHDRASDELHFPYVAEDDPAVGQSLAALRFPADKGVAGAVLREGRPLRLDDVNDDARFFPDVDRRSGFTTRNMLAAPLTTGHGTIGVLQVVNHRAGTPFDDDDLDLLAALAASVAVAIENARLWAAMKTLTERLRSEVGVLRRDLAQRDHFDDMVASAPAMEEVLRLMEGAAASPISVLIEGETGTGKELVARGIHRASARAASAFVAVNCAALPETLLESELFGHRRGAFTGATHDQVGLFETASGGTIFLDEIGEMPAPMQAKLLRVLQEGEITPVGDRRPRRVDVRVVSATNRDLATEVRERRFRDDLYYRLGAFPIRLPPLRERREDIPLLATRFVRDAAERHRKRIAGLAPEGLERLARFDWPGNIRELQNEIERAVALAAEGETLCIRHLSAKLAVPAAAPASTIPRTTSDLRDARTGFEIDFIARVLRENDGNVSWAAKALGISRVALQKKMKEYGLR